MIRPDAMRVKMGIHLLNTWDKPKEMVKVEKYMNLIFIDEYMVYQLKSWINSIYLFKSV